jgi:hypothetical protein
MYKLTGKEKYLNAAQTTNQFVRKTQHTKGLLDIQGAIKGSFPTFGDYGKYEFLCWAAKYFIDSNTTELEVSTENANAEN